MELLFLLLALVIVVLPIAGFVLALIALRRVRESSARADTLEVEMSRLQREIRRLKRPEGASETEPEGASETAPEGASETAPSDAAASPPPARPVAPAAAPPEGRPSRPEPPATPVPSPPATPPPVRTEAPRPAFTASAPSAADRPAPPSTPPPPPRPPSRPEPPSPPAPPDREGGVDWERWLGVRGAAVLAGILLALAGVYFVRYSIEAGWLSPAVRVALGLLAGLAALGGSEVLRRRDYVDASNGLAGGGIVVLYAAVWAARSLYGLIPMALAFALMVLVTAVCGLLAWRRASLVVALLGLIGGFATPLLVSAETTSPLGLFGYLLLLNTGLLVLGRKRGWPLIPPLGLLATLFYEALWITGDMTPRELPLALGILTVFAALFVVALLRAVPATVSTGGGAGSGETGGILWTGTRAGAILLPFAFALYFALRADLGEHLWPVAAMLVVLSVGAEALGRRWSRQEGPGTGPAERTGLTEKGDLGWLGPAAAVASVTIVAVWALDRQATAATAWELTGIAAALALTFHAFAELDFRRADRRGGQENDDEDDLVAPARLPVESAGIAAAGLFALLILDGLADSPPFLLARGLGWLLMVALLVRQSVLPGVHRRQAWAALALGATLPLFYQAHLGRPGPDGLPDLPDPVLYYGLVLAVGVIFQLLPALWHRTTTRQWSLRAAQLFALGGLAFFAGTVAEPTLAPWLALTMPLALAVLATLGATRIERPTGVWVLVAMGLAAFEHLLWATDRTFGPESTGRAAGISPHALGLIAGAVGVLFFAAWPFLARPRLDGARWAWYAAALAGPGWFLALGFHWDKLFGDGAIGALPLLLGAVALTATARVRTLWSADDPRRLRGLVWFAAVALGFAALAIPLQLDKEWVTIGWALEGVAVIALWRRLDHAGLKLFGLALLAIVAVRVVLLPPLGSSGSTGLGSVWLAYTHLVPLAALAGAALLLEPLEVARLRLERSVYPAGRPLGAILCALGAIAVGFAWITRTVHVLFHVRPAALAGLAPSGSIGSTSMGHDLTLSIAWALYALLLLGLGFARTSRGLRGLGLGLMAVTVIKVFLFDLSGLEDLYRVASLVGLAISLMLVSLAYQRFVFRAKRSPAGPAGSSGTPREDSMPPGDAV